MHRHTSAALTLVKCILLIAMQPARTEERQTQGVTVVCVTHGKRLLRAKQSEA